MQTVTVILTALGGGSAIVFALSGWLGKVWAERLMARETAAHTKELESLRADLQEKSDRASHTYKLKLELYKEVSGPLVELVSKSQLIGELTREDMLSFETARLNSTSLLAMFAPKAVCDEYNSVIDYIFDCTDGDAVWSFSEFRARAYRLLTHIRQDIGLYSDDVSYSGHR